MSAGDLFMNFVNLQGLVIAPRHSMVLLKLAFLSCHGEAKNSRGDPLWFVIGIQADVTHVCLEKAPEQLPRLHEVAQVIRDLDQVDQGQIKDHKGSKGT